MSNVLFSDTFVRANGAIGANYGTQSGYNAFVISANDAIPSSYTSGDAGSLNTSATYPNDQWAQITVGAIGTANGAGVGVILRGSTSANTLYRIFGSSSPGVVFLYKRVAGVGTLLATATGVSLIAGDVLYAQAVGTTITVSKNGTQILSVTDASISSGIPGIHYSSTDNASDSIAAFSAGNFFTLLSALASGGSAGTAAMTSGIALAAAAAGESVFTPILVPAPPILSQPLAYGIASIPAACSDGLYRGQFPLGSPAPVQISPTAGTYTGTQTITLSCSTTDASIYYTTDGSAPAYPISGTTQMYTAPLSVAVSQVVNAIAISQNRYPTDIASASYTIYVAPPVLAAAPTFSPSAGTYGGAQSVTLASATPGAVIHYTTDGSTPTGSSTVYSSPITVSATTQVRAIASAGGFLNSTVASATYTISASAALGFPVTGYWNAQPQTSNNAYLQGLAHNYNFNIFVGWIFSPTIPSNMQYVKAQATAAGNYCKTLVYQIDNEWWPSTSAVGFFDYAMLAALNLSPYWWLVSNYPGTTQVASQDGLPKVATNTTSASPVVNVASMGSIVGPGNVNCPQMLAWLFYQEYVLGNSKALNSSNPVYPANPYLDGVLQDNQETSPSVSGCWLNTAVNYVCNFSTQNPSVMPAQATGFSQRVAKMRSLYSTTPGGTPFLNGGNCGGFPFGSAAVYPAAVHGLYDIAMAENPFGLFEYYGGSVYTTMLAAFVAYEVLLNQAPGNYCVILTESPSSVGTTQTPFTSSLQSAWLASDWQAIRYQLGNAMLMRWSWWIGPAAGQVWQFDEVLGGTTYNKLNWAGQPVGARSLTPWLAQGPYGLYLANFDNCVWIINPKGNGAQTFNMPFSGHFLATLGYGGSYNNGAAFTASTRMTLQDRDAVCVRNA
jgi:hypothetical protein